MKGKLVRDKIPEIILKNEGSVPRVRTLSIKEYQQELRRKLVEEAKEVLLAKTKKEVVMELADVQEVMLALSESLSVSENDITLVQKKKKKERGGFSKRIFLIH
jgi:predicted house-cleaning noncanonical NTP pyrophosphatase (MazG superfamily)